MASVSAKAEEARVAALRRYQLLDTPPEETFDRITRIVKKVLDVPMAAIALIDEKRHWLKSRQGPLGLELPREITFCNDTIRGETLLHVTDASLDARYADNPMVSGEPHLRFYAGIPLRSPDGHAVGALCCLDTVPRSLTTNQLEILGDLAHIVVDEFELRLVAATDHLTGVLTRRAFRDDAERDLTSAVQAGAPFSCIVFDIDLFKPINDTYGHAAGDAVLKNVAGHCDTLLQGYGYIGRLDGEEFGVILPGIGMIGATRVAEALREMIAGLETHCLTGIVAVTISAGIASTGDQKQTSFDELLAQADRAVYAAKRAGRNLCIRSDEADFVAREWACVA